MAKKVRRSDWFYMNQPSQEQRTQEEENQLLNSYYYIMVNDERFISVDNLVSFENQLDDSWE